MKVLVAGINKVDLLLNLYNNANFQGSAFDQQQKMKALGQMTSHIKGNRAKAEELINEGKKYFDYVDLGAGPRPLKISFDGFEIETSSYDEYNGEGLGASVVEAIRAEMIKQNNVTGHSIFGSLLGMISNSFRSQGEDVAAAAPMSPKNKSRKTNKM